MTLAVDARCAALALLVLVAGGCGDGSVERPNVLFVVWDTTRADRLGLYGHDRPTTPFLDTFAQEALVFEDCLSTGGSTVPSHGSMFTGLLPREHGASNVYRYLDDAHETLAELFLADGYDTYAFAANPHISREENFTQGFEVEQHPWDLELQADALRILRDKVSPQDRSSELAQKVRRGQVQSWDIKACGELANREFARWLDGRDGRDGRAPFFAFLNYMEAHRPFVPSDAARRRVMTPEQVERSYAIDRSWDTMWDFTFGLHEYTDEELEIMALTYDASISELDVLFRELIAALEKRGVLDDTVVVLVGDHGEHLGEHHMLDHQYSIYQGLVHVPLVLRYPRVVDPGRSRAPVAGYDVFPTLLELCGIDPPPGNASTAVSLLAPREDRWRLAESGSHYVYPMWTAKKRHPEWDSTPFERGLTGFVAERAKLIRSTKGEVELYDLDADPLEANDLAATRPDEASKLDARLRSIEARLTVFDAADASRPLSEEQRKRLEALGYFGGEDE